MFKGLLIFLPFKQRMSTVETRGAAGLKKTRKWQAEFAGNMKFKKQDVLLLVAPRRFGRTRALGMVYVAARKAGITKIKFLCMGKTLNKEFFEEVLPACGYDDMFAAADNETLKLADAELIIVDDCHLRGAEKMTEIVETVRKTHTPLVLSSIVGDGEVMRDDERKSMAPLTVLTRRTVRHTSDT